MLKGVHDFGKCWSFCHLLYLLCKVYVSQALMLLLLAIFHMERTLSQSLPFSLKPKNAKETELSNRLEDTCFFTLHTQISIFSLDVGHFFLCSASQFPCLHQLADETAAPGPTCAQDAARRRKMHGLDCSLFRLGSKPVIKPNKEIQKCCHTLPCSTLFLLVPFCSLHLGFRATLRPRSGMMQPSSQTLEPKMPVLMDGSEMMRSEVKLMNSWNLSCQNVSQIDEIEIWEYMRTLPECNLSPHLFTPHFFHISGSRDRGTCLGRAAAQVLRRNHATREIHREALGIHRMKRTLKER